MPTYSPLTPVGVRVSDARVDELDDGEIDDLRTALATHGVAVIPPGQDVDDEVFLRFVRRFGETVFTVGGETPVPGRPELNVVTNVGRTRPPRSNFHTDTSYISNPPAYTALRAVSVPERGAGKPCSPTSTRPTRRCPVTSASSSTGARSHTSSPG